MAEEKRVGVWEGARLARISIGTMDRALNGRPEISEKARERILKLPQEHSYQPNPVARALSVGRSKFRIGVCLPRDFHVFYDQIRDGILAEAAQFRHAGVEILYQRTDHLGAGEVNVIKNVLKQGVHALILTSRDPAALAPIIDKAETKADVGVVRVASDDSSSRRSMWSAVDPEMNGSMAAELMANFLPANSGVAVVTGMLKTKDHARKVASFSEAFPRDCPGGSIVDFIEGNDCEEETYKKTLRLLRSGKKLDGIYVSTAIMLPVWRALEETGKAGRIQVIATDLFLEAVPHLLGGTISAIVYQRPYTQGQMSVRLLMDHILNGSRLPERYPIASAVVVNSNLAMFREVRKRAEVLAIAAPRGISGS